MAIQGTAESYVSANIGLFRGSEAQRLASMLADPAYETVPSRAMEQGASMTERSLAKLASLPTDEFKKQFSKLVYGEAPIDQSGQEVLEMDRAVVLADLQQVADSQRNLARALASGSTDEYDVWAQQNNDLLESNPLAKVIMPWYDQYLNRADRAAINRAFVEAGLAVAQDGPSALSSHLDPSTSQPFIYTETSDGFELQSGFKTNGVPLKMQFK
jgi:hypothetical protein